MATFGGATACTGNANQRYSNHLPALGEGEDTGVGSGPPVSVADLPVLARNNKAFKQGKWRKEPFDTRKYERLPAYQMARHASSKLDMGEHDGKVPLRTTLDNNILICQPYNDEEIVQVHPQGDYRLRVGLLAIKSDTDETSKPTTEPLWRKRHLLMKDEDSSGTF